MSNSWHDEENWDSGSVPDANSTVTIRSVSPKPFPVITQNITVKEINLPAWSSGELTVTNNATLTLSETFNISLPDEETVLMHQQSGNTIFYSISFLQYHMTDDGSFEEITEPKPGQMFADPVLRYFPRSIELAPGESQVVRMQLRRLPNMEESEYRSHLYFREVPDEKPLGKEELLSDTTAIGIRLTPIFGISIPVIVRIGDLSASLTLTGLALEKTEDNRLVLKTVLNREGNQSVYDDLTANYILPGAEPLNVRLVRGIAVYMLNTLRRFSMPLNVPEGIDLSKGKLVVRFSSSNEAKPIVFDEKELVLN